MGDTETPNEDEVLRRMLKTPPKPHKKGGEPKPAPPNFKDTREGLEDCPVCRNRQLSSGRYDRFDVPPQPFDRAQPQA